MECPGKPYPDFWYAVHRIVVLPLIRYSGVLVTHFSVWAIVTVHCKCSTAYAWHTKNDCMAYKE